MDIVKSTERRIAVALQGRRPQAEERDPTGERGPRKYLFDDLFVQRYDESSLDAGGATPLWDAVPSWVRLAREVQRRRDDYDAIVTWSERVTLSLMTLQSLQRTRKPHIAMMYWFSRPSVRLPMLAFARSLHAIVTWSSAQRRYAIERLAIPAEKIYLIKHFVDPLFFSPRERMLDTLCSAGAEMRDYPTLLKALRGTDLPCHLATDHVRVANHGLRAQDRHRPIREPGRRQRDHRQEDPGGSSRALRALALRRGPAAGIGHRQRCLRDPGGHGDG
jgi:hypothetical protein